MPELEVQRVASVQTILKRDVLPEQYEDFKTGYTCRRLSDKFTPPCDIKNSTSYLFECDKAEMGELQPPLKKTKVELPELVQLFNAEMKKQQGEMKQQLQAEMKKQMQAEMQKQQAELQAEMKKQQAQMQSEFAKERDADRRRISRLEFYERAGTCLKVASCDLLSFFCNQLSWKVRSFMSNDMRGKRPKHTEEELFGADGFFTTWNTVTYPMLVWERFKHWKLVESKVVPVGIPAVDVQIGTMRKYWSDRGYKGEDLPEPRVEQQPDELTDMHHDYKRMKYLETVKDYLNRAEKWLAGELGQGIKEDEIGLLFGVYVTCVRDTRNKNVHMFSLFRPIWKCDVDEDQQQKLTETGKKQQEYAVKIPAGTLKTARKPPAIQVLDLAQLRLMIEVLRRVMDEINTIPGVFSTMASLILKLQYAVRDAISKSAGLRILKNRGVDGAPVRGTSLIWTAAGVKDMKTAEDYFIDKETGVWSRAADGRTFDATVNDLFQDGPATF